MTLGDASWTVCIADRTGLRRLEYPPDRGRLAARGELVASRQRRRFRL